MSTSSFLQEAPTHSCGEVLRRMPVSVQENGIRHDRVVGYCDVCKTYIYGVPGKDRLETEDPKEMGDYITKLIESGKFIW